MSTFDSTGDQIPWGTDASLSLPHPMEDLNAVAVDVGGGFVFTPMGLRFAMNDADRDALLAQAYRPQGEN